MKTEIKYWVIYDWDRFIVQSNYIEETMFMGFSSRKSVDRTRAKCDVGVWIVKPKQLKHAD
jgi:hypothetical protein